MPLQRNFSNLNWQDVWPILEDEKGEETVIGDIDIHTINNTSPVIKKKTISRGNIRKTREEKSIFWWILIF